MSNVFGGGNVVAFLPRRVSLNAMARREMDAFDSLSPEARQIVANSRFGFMVADVLDVVRRRGARNAVRERLRERGLFPCDVGNEGVMLEELAIAEEAESRRLRCELGI